jgi:hypothetical protein
MLQHLHWKVGNLGPAARAGITRSADLKRALAQAGRPPGR